MRHGYFGKKLSRTKNERRRLLQILSRDVIKHGQIRTTLAKAKAVQPLIEKLITKAKKATNGQKQSLMKVLADKESTASLLLQAKTRFQKRNSGFTRILKLGKRVGDASEVVILGFVDALAPVVQPVAQAHKPEDSKTVKSTGGAKKKSLKK